MDDRELVRRAAEGDREAWALIWDAHGARLYAYARRLLSDEHDAADAVADTFVTAAEHLGELREPERLRAWLYAICRRHVQKRWEGRDRVRPVEATVLTAVLDSRADLMSEPGGTSPAEAAELLWAAAEGIGPADRELLTLLLQADLDSGDVASITGQTPSAVYVKVSRLKDTLGRAAGALMVARHSRRDCADLSVLLGAWDGSYSSLWRKRIARHVDACGACDLSRTALAGSLFSLAGAAPLLVVPQALRDRALDGAMLVSFSTAPPPVPTTTEATGELTPERAVSNLQWRDGWPAARPWPARSARRRRKTAAFVAAVSTLLLAGGALWAGGDTAVPTLAAGQESTVTTSVPTTSPSVTPLETPVASAATPSELTADAVPSVSPAPAPSPSITRSPVAQQFPLVPPLGGDGRPPVATAPSPVPSTAPEPSNPALPPAPTVGLTLRDRTLDTACGADTTTSAVASATGGVAPLQVVLSWDGTSPNTQSFTGEGPHSATVGPFSSVRDPSRTDTVTVVATVTDSAGRTSTDRQTLTVSIAPC